MNFNQVKRRFTKLLLLVFLLKDTLLVAKNNPNPPTPMGSGGFDDGVVVGGPINDFLPILAIIAITYGVYSQYKKVNTGIMK